MCQGIAAAGLLAFSPHICSQEAESQEHTLVLKLTFGIFNSSGSPGQRTGGFTTIKMVLPASTNVIEILPHRHAQRPVFQVTLDSQVGNTNPSCHSQVWAIFISSVSLKHVFKFYVYECFGLHVCLWTTCVPGVHSRPEKGI